MPKNIQTKKFNFYFKYTRVENKRTSLAMFSNTVKIHFTSARMIAKETDCIYYLMRIKIGLNIYIYIYIYIYIHIYIYFGKLIKRSNKSFHLNG